MEVADDLAFDRVIVCPTWACNLRCWYCYQDHLNERMSESVVCSLEKFLARSSLRAEWLWLEFFGGEPLLCPDIIERLARSAQRECKSSGIPFFGSVTTNAYLLDEVVLKRLTSAGVCHYQITLDGVPDFHDQQRALVSGRGSWDRIWKSLQTVRESAARVKITLRLHFQVDHLDSALRLVADYINPNFSTDDRFSVQFEEIKPLGGNQDHRIRLSNPDENREAIRQLIGALTNPRMLVGLSADSYDCYASRSSSIVILPDSGLAKCTVSLARIGRLSEEGRVEFVEERIQEWESRSRICPGCPKNAVSKETPRLHSIRFVS